MTIVKLAIFILGLIMLAACIAADMNRRVKKTKLVPKKANSGCTWLVFLAMLVGIIVFAVPAYNYISKTLLFNENYIQ